jgi:subtilisin family serine protease
MTLLVMRDCAFALLLGLAMASMPFVVLSDGPAPLLAVADDDDDDDRGNDDDDDDDDDGPRVVRRAEPLPDFVPDEVLLINPSEAALDRSRSLGFLPYATEVLASEQLTIVRLRLPPGLDAPAALALLRRETPDQISDLNHLYRLQQQAKPAATRDPYDCGTSRCYGQEMIGWSEALASCSSGVRVGILDTGIDTTHPALRGRNITAVSFVAPPARRAETQHGTGIAALLVGTGAGGGVPGLLPSAQVYAADVFHTAPDGRQGADAVTIARGLGWLGGQGVDVINVSLAGSENRLLTAAVDAVLARNIRVVAAAGNDGPSAPPRHPAALPGVLAVTAIDRRKRPYRRAAKGAHIAYAAPGVSIWTAQSRGRQGIATGTSYAAPFVTAVVALLRKDNRTARPEAEDLGAPGRDEVFGEGLVRAPQRCGREVSRN